MKAIKYLLLLYLLSLVSIAYSQIPADYGFSQIENAPDRIYDLFIDSKSFIWIGHELGIARYDGTSFTSYSNTRQRSLGIDYISEDSEGRIWCRNFSGQIFYIEDGKMKLLETEDPSLNLSLFEIVNQELIAKCNKGVFSYNLNTDSGKVISTADNYPIQNIAETIFKYKEKVFFLAQIDGHTYLLEYKNGKLSRYKSKLDKKYLSIVTVDDHQVLFKDGGNNDDHTFFCKKNDHLFKSKTLQINGGRTYSISSKNRNETWIHTLKESILLSDSTKIKNLSLTDYLADREDNIWASSLLYGLMIKKRKPEWELLPAKTKTSHITSLARVGDRVVAGTTNNETLISDIGAFFISKNGGNTTTLKYRFFGIETIDSFYYMYGQGILKMTNTFKPIYEYATYVTASSIMDDEVLVFAAPQGMVALPKDKKTFLHIIKQKPNIISTHFNYNSANQLFYSNQNKTRVKAIYYCPFSKVLYAGFSNGLFEYTKDTLKEIKNNNIPIYAHDIKNHGANIYVATLNNGIIVLNNSKITKQLNKTTGLLSSSVLNLKLFGTHLWILGLDGIQLYDVKEERFIDSVVLPPIKSTQVFDIMELNGNVYFSSINGIYKVPLYRKGKEVLPLNYLMSAIVNTKDTIQNGAKLTNTNNSLQFNLVGLYYFNPAEVYFAYRLKSSGIDTNWKYTPPGQNQISFPYMAPGDYVFEAVAKTANGLTAEDKILFSFTIKKPWWQQLWFITSVTLSTALLSYIFVTIRIKNRKRANQLIIDKLKYESAANDSELKALKSQMNPHFIFNSLNTIQELFMWGDKSAANEQLSNFAMLLRLILSISGKKSISLSTEIEVLKRYLELEKMRFQESFSYEIIIDEEIDEDYIQIPSMILQPFVENSIRHGLLHKEGEKHLKVDFTTVTDSDYIICTITDNGIGREKASEIKKTKGYTHNSFAIKAIRKQLQLMRKENQGSLSVIYTDLRDEKGQASGTSVRITIPTFMN